MNPRAVAHHLRAVRRLVIGGNTFQEVRLLCDHIQSLGRETHTPLHVPLFAGVCVTYMKPFVESNGLGPLPDEFKAFPSRSKHRKIHAELESLRNWYYAHRDMINAPKLLSDRASADAFDEITLHVDEEGIPSFSISELSWPIESVERVRDLCAFQRSRVDRAALQHLSVLAKAKALPPGEYLLGRDFPDPKNI